VQQATGYPADITNDLVMTALAGGAAKGLGKTGPYLARAADQVEGMANRAGYTLRKPANVYGSGPMLTRLVDETDNLISSQEYLNDALVVDKLTQGDNFQVSVSPPFELNGRTVRVVLDGHHRLAAAKQAGRNPEFREMNATENDAVGLLNEGAIEDFLRAVHKGDDYKFVNSGKSVF
jgi:hypothetical protein